MYSNLLPNASSVSHASSPLTLPPASLALLGDLGQAAGKTWLWVALLPWHYLPHACLPLLS